MQFAEVILPLPLKGTFTYQIPEPVKNLHIGSRVIVQFGAKKIYTGIITSFSENAPQGYIPKEVLASLDDEPMLTEKQLEFIQWVSQYYMCTLGEGYQAAFPSGLKLSSDSYVSVNPEIDIMDLDLEDDEYLLVNSLVGKELKLTDVTKITGKKNPYRQIKSLNDRGILDTHERLEDKYIPKKEKRIRLHDSFLPEESLDILSEQLTNKSKQLEVLVEYLKQVPILEEPSANAMGIPKKQLLEEGISPSSLKTLVKHGVFVEWEEIIDRTSIRSSTFGPIAPLSPDQESALKEILTSFDSHRTTLLQGVTGSGKTEIYMQLIEKTINEGCQVLYLLPEIALTTQIIKRFSRVFGNRFGVYHSRFSDNERVEIYKKCLHRELDFVIGVRSSIFLPFENLGLIIVDEEHEHSYKQYDPAPRYNARDAAIYLAGLFKANVLLGTATPSMETYLNAQEGRYGWVKLEKRYHDLPQPQVSFVDLSRARKQRRMKGSFSSDLIEVMHETLEKGRQVILFQNRRGYSPFIQCTHCGHIPKCPNCSVSLTYHVFQNQLICHYCGHHRYMMVECTECQSHDIITKGSGTEKLEEELEVLMPDITIQRMDLDSTRSKHSYQRIIDDFEQKKIDVLIGTQMISKGLDFEHVQLVGVFDIDRLLHFPDFRSHERTYQLITQVSGRAGRKHEQGKVIIQTNNQNDPLLQLIFGYNQEEFYKNELQEREHYKYPPYWRMIKVVIRHRDKQVSAEAASQLYHWMIKELGQKRISIPIEPLINKIRNLYYHEIIIRVEKQGIRLAALKEFLDSSRDTLLALPPFKSVKIHFDVDPL